MVGIVSYGFYIPKYRITVNELAKVWGKSPTDVKRSLNIREKTVSYLDEDSLTMAYESAAMAFAGSKIKKEDVRVIFFGSESPPYAVNPASTILAEFLGIEKNYLASDNQFACKAATGALISAVGLIQNNFTKYALVTASDKATAKPHDALEYTAASGSVSLIVGKTNVALEILGYDSFSSDTPDFWRRDGIRYPSHSGRFTGKPAYFYHIQNATKNLLQKTKLNPSDFKYAIFHMPNGKFPQEVARSLGFSEKQIEAGLTVPFLGNSYTASALLGLISTLNRVKTGDLIFFASYGSGAGSDSFVFRVTNNLQKVKKDFQKALADKNYIDYPTYLKFMHMI